MCAQPMPAATARAAGLLTKVGSDLDAACGAVGAAVASDVRSEYTRSAPPFVYAPSLGVKRSPTPLATTTQEWEGCPFSPHSGLASACAVGSLTTPKTASVSSILTDGL